MKLYITIYQQAILRDAKRVGWVRVHRTSSNCWYRRRELLKLTQAGLLKVCTPVMGSYMTFVPATGEPVEFNANEFPAE